MERYGGIHVCLGPSDLLTDIWWDCSKAYSVCLLFGPRNPLGRYTIKIEEALVGFVVSPTFMLGKWNKGDWMKERFRSTQYMVRWYVEVPDLVDFCICQ